MHGVRLRCNISAVVQLGLFDYLIIAPSHVYFINIFFILFCLFMCVFSQSLPGSMKNLENVERLLLGANKLRALPHDIGNLQKLSNLWLEDNQLEALPESMTKLTSLQKVILGSLPKLASMPLESASPYYVRCDLLITAKTVQQQLNENPRHHSVLGA